MTMCTVPTVVTPHSATRERRTDRRISAGKRLAMVRAFPGKVRTTTRRSLDPCDNSNDSGLGFDHHIVDHRTNLTDRLTWTGERAEAKRPRLDIKLEDDEINDNFSFPETIRTCKDTMSIIRTAPSSTTPSLNLHGTQSSNGTHAVPRCTPLISRVSSSQSVNLTSQLANVSREASVSLRIISQPEQQHRARYQTEGSRGAVKDRTGNGFPVVQLVGYQKPATLQVFIGTDVGKPSPHMFYQACRVSGKNSTPCTEKKLEGTVVIELQLDPSKDMIGTCDCVGILKERNVDVEHRFPDQIGSRSKKKSTRCRMVFRTTVTHDNGQIETLQVCSQPIVCTQPPGVPEICKKSLTSCPATGGLELFILGKNFLKDTKVVFQQVDDQGLCWDQFVVPDKEFLQQTHLVCVVPPYARTNITEPVTVRLLVVSSGKTSEPHQFVYTPTNGAVSSVHTSESTPSATFSNKVIWSSINKHEQGIMPPPGTNQMPIAQRRPSINTSSEISSPPLNSLKQELMDENSQNSIIDPLELHRERYRNLSESSMDVQQGDSNITMINESSMDMLRRSSVSMDAISQSINENSMNEIMRHDVSLVNSSNNCITESNILLPTTTTTVRSCTDLPVMDLRMKMPAATVADLALTNAPSMATLQSFGITEATSTPLLAQTAQSIENYLSTIETKTVNVESMGFANNALQLSQLLSASHQTRPTQKISQTQCSVLDSTHLSTIQPHLNTTFHSSAPSLLPVRTLPLTNDQVLLQQSVLTENMMQAAMEENIISKLNSALNPRDRNVHSPQDILMETKSALISDATTQDILLSATTTSPNLLMSPTVNTTLSPTVEQSNLNSTTQNTPNISPDIMLNSQLSPSMMCRTPTALNQDVLLTTICQTSPADATIISPQAASRQHSSESSPVRSPVALSNQLINATEPEKAILLKAAVDLLETQKKLNELETFTGNNASSIEQVIMNNILSSPTRDSNQGNNMQQRSVPVAVKDITGQMQNEKKNADHMIPTGFATMSENELINIINPSCFDQGNNFH
ncbi:nuclear factor of activated T-cells 5-like isoform X3 [Photinus pyralis]|nr:nuclear factor of activated T-cells 5-like isoform X3 [Photinus pyralis]